MTLQTMIGIIIGSNILITLLQTYLFNKDNASKIADQTDALLKAHDGNPLVKQAEIFTANIMQQLSSDIFARLSTQSIPLVPSVTTTTQTVSTPASVTQLPIAPEQLPSA